MSSGPRKQEHRIGEFVIHFRGDIFILHKRANRCLSSLTLPLWIFHQLAVRRGFSPPMVQKNIENFNEYKIVYSGTDMPVGDKQQPVRAKKVALRELSNETHNTFMEPLENSSVQKERGFALDVVNTYNVKRQKPSLYSPSRPLPPGCIGPNGHLVYVRRQLDTEAKKIVAVDKVNSAKPPSSRKTIRDGSKELKVQKDLTEETKVSPSVYAPVSPDPVNTSSAEAPVVPSLGKTTEYALPEPNHSEGTNAITEKPTSTGEPSSLLSLAKLTETILPEPNHSEGINAIADEPASTGEPSIVLSLGKPTKTVLPEPNHYEVINAIADQSASTREPSILFSRGKFNETFLPETNHSEGMNAIADLPNPTRQSGLHWKERFQKLQTFLQKCDQSNQEEYIQKLQSLTAIGRSRHGVELERRAIRLRVEEAKELKRMKVLNVLGKTSGMTQAPISTETHSSDQNIRGK